MSFAQQGAAVVAATNYDAKHLGSWLGPDAAEAQLMYRRARGEGMSTARAQVLAHIASRKDCWAFARYIAKVVGVSVRTVCRAIAQGKALGLINTARAKKGEIPPGGNAPIKCGWSHRWVIGRGLAGQLLKAAIDKARARWVTNLFRRQTVPSELAKLASKPAPRRPPEGMTTEQRAAWLDRELAELDAERKARDGP